MSNVENRPLRQRVTRGVVSLVAAGSLGACATGGEAQPPVTTATLRPSTTLFVEPTTTTQPLPTTTEQKPIIVDLGAEGTAQVLPATTVFETTTTAEDLNATRIEEALACGYTGEFIYAGTEADMSRRPETQRGVSGEPIPIGLYTEPRPISDNDVIKAYELMGIILDYYQAPVNGDATGHFVKMAFGKDNTGKETVANVLLGLQYPDGDIRNDIGITNIKLYLMGESGFDPKMTDISPVILISPAHPDTTITQEIPGYKNKKTFQEALEEHLIKGPGKEGEYGRQALVSIMTEATPAWEGYFNELQSITDVNSVLGIYRQGQIPAALLLDSVKSGTPYQVPDETYVYAFDGLITPKSNRVPPANDQC